MRLNMVNCSKLIKNKCLENKEFCKWEKKCKSLHKQKRTNQNQVLSSSSNSSKNSANSISSKLPEGSKDSKSSAPSTPPKSPIVPTLSATNSNSSSSQNFDSAEFDNIKTKSDKNYTISECVNAFMTKGGKGKNGKNAEKQEYLLTQLHLKLSERTDIIAELSQIELEYLKKLEDEWKNILSEVFKFDIHNSNYEIKQRSNEKGYYYDVRIQYEKNEKKCEKRIDLKVYPKNKTTIQFKDIPIHKNRKPFDEYIGWFYDNHFTNVFENFKQSYPAYDVDILSKELYLKEAVKRCLGKENGQTHHLFVEMIRLKEDKQIKKNKEFAKYMEEISTKSISQFIDEKYKKEQINATSLSWLLPVVKEKKSVHYFTWSRKDKRFFYFNYKQEIKKFPDLLKDSNIQIIKGKYKKIKIKSNDTTSWELSLTWKNGLAICNPYLKLQLSSF